MAEPALQSASHKRILGAAMAGTAVEFYDFYIFATAASLVFGPLFFPTSSPEAQLLQSWLTFALAFIARPVGALVFGHYGDRIGRKATLVWSLMIMGVSTFCIALLPSYAVAGWWAPLLLCILRFGQGFGLGGEWGGAALLAVENAPEGKKSTVRTSLTGSGSTPARPPMATRSARMRARRSMISESGVVWGNAKESGERCQRCLA